MTDSGSAPAALHAERVWFSFRNHDWVLRDISLVIPAGKVLRPRVMDGARVTAWAVVDNGVLTLRRVVVRQRAVA